MRRIVDGVLPVCAAIALWPLALRIFPIPESLANLVGEDVAWIWCLSMALSFTSITVGVIISTTRPATAFWLQVIPLSYAGIWFTVFIVGIVLAFGLVRTWQNVWWELGIAGYFFARSMELFNALREAKRLERIPLDTGEPE